MNIRIDKTKHVGIKYFISFLDALKQCPFSRVLGAFIGRWESSCIVYIFVQALHAVRVLRHDTCPYLCRPCTPSGRWGMTRVHIVQALHSVRLLRQDTCPYRAGPALRPCVEACTAESSECDECSISRPCMLSACGVHCIMYIMHVVCMLCALYTVYYACCLHVVCIV